MAKLRLNVTKPAPASRLVNGKIVITRPDRLRQAAQKSSSPPAAPQPKVMKKGRTWRWFGWVRPKPKTESPDAQQARSSRVAWQKAVKGAGQKQVRPAETPMPLPEPEAPEHSRPDQAWDKVRKRMLAKAEAQGIKTKEVDAGGNTRMRPLHIVMAEMGYRPDSPETRAWMEPYLSLYYAESRGQGRVEGNGVYLTPEGRAGVERQFALIQKEMRQHLGEK